MNKSYQRINWENYPSEETPLNKQNLNRMDASLDEVDNRIISLDTTKATKSEVAPLIKEIVFNESNGIFTITRKDGSSFTIDTKLEKIAVNFTYNPTTQQIVLTLIDGTKQYIDLSALITEYEFMDTDTVSFFVDSDGKVSAIVKEGSIQEKHLQPNYLAEIKVEVAKAQASANTAGEKATEASNYATEAESYAHGGTGTREGEDADNAKEYYEKSKLIYDDFTAGAVTGVKGNAESAYRKGNVNITTENLGLGNVGNFKAVSTVASQGLSDTEKANARENIGAGTSSFSGDYDDLTNKPTGLPADGGNADTVDGKHASDFASAVAGEIKSSVTVTVGSTKVKLTPVGIDALSGQALAIIAGANAKYMFGNGFYCDGNYYQEDLGNPNYKWRNIYATNGVIQTSDRTKKTDITPLPDELTKDFVMGLIPSSYGMASGTSGRTHWGLISQDIEELMDRLGMDSTDFAGFIKSPKVIIHYEDENGNRLKKPIEEVIEGEYEYSLRYDEFIAPLIKMVQMQQSEIETLKEDKEQLENRLAIIEAHMGI